MAIVSKQFTVDENGPYLVIKGGAGHDMKTVIISNTSDTVYFGGDDVDATIGLPVPTGATLSLELSSQDNLYAHAAAEETFNILATRSDDSQFGAGVTP